MRLKVLLFLTFLAQANLESVAQVTYVSSGTGGDWLQATTWGNAGVPGNADNVIISSGTVVTHTANENIARVQIQSGGELVSNARLRVTGSYTNDGLHSGIGRVELRDGNDTIAGTGLITTTSIFRVNNGRTIISGSDLTRTGQNFRCPNNDTLFNFGTLTLERSLNGNGTATFVNGPGATLNIQRAALTNGTFVASALNNTVNYNRTGGNNTNIKQTFDGYYNLEIDGNNLNSDKIINAPIRVLNDLTINGSTLQHTDTFSLYIGGDLTLNDGAYESTEGRIVFDGTAAQSISGNFTLNDIHINSTSVVSIISDSINLTGMLTVANGPFNSNGRLVVVSNATQEGQIGEISSSGSVNGDVVIQRYIDAGATNWRFMGSQITNATFEDWDDDFVTAGFPGSDYPNFHFTSIYGYDESVVGHQDSGLYTISSSDPITPGVGYWVFCGDSLNGTDPFTIDLVGPINQGQIDFGVTYTPLTALAEDGWNLVSNPYPSPIDWDDPTWVKLNVDSTIYIWNTDLNQYASYANGVGNNGGSNIIASGQGFYVKANMLLPILRSEESVKYDTTASFLRQKPIDDMILRVNMNQNGDKCETVVRVNSRAKVDYNGSLDAYHIPALGENKSDLHTLKKQEHTSINATKCESTEMIPLRASGNNGSATLEFRSEIYRDDFCIMLWNTDTDEQFIIDGEGSLTVEFESDADTNQFILIISRKSSTATDCTVMLSMDELANDDYNVGYYANGLVVLTENVAYSILDVNARLIRSGKTSDNRIDMSPYSPGVYFLKTPTDILKFVHE